MSARRDPNGRITSGRVSESRSLYLETISERLMFMAFSFRSWANPRAARMSSKRKLNPTSITS